MIGSIVSTEDRKLNDFATRSFRDIADNDYIAARLAFRHRLVQQALWSSLQAVEKYLKAILLYNRVPAKKLGHNIVDGLALVRSKVKFEVKLTKKAEEFIQYLDGYGRWRYYETSYYVLGPEMVFLDHTVWYLRRYCRVLDYQVVDLSGKVVEMLQHEILAIEESEKKPFNQFRVLGGQLETIIDDIDHQARPALVWQNGFFGKRVRKRVRPRGHMSAGNAPLLMHPEILDDVLKYVYLPKEAEQAYREHAVRGKTTGAD